MFSLQGKGSDWCSRRYFGKYWRKEKEVISAKLRERLKQLSNQKQIELKRIYFGIQDMFKELEMVMAIDEG